jgi:hypothetical protein
LTLSPISDDAAAPFVGQNMAVSITTGQHGGRQWVVPVSAVVTDAAGRSSITLLRGNREISISVRAGLAFQGGEVVIPEDGRLHAGDQVVLGATQ